jgi:hypothetical protein
MVCEWISIRLTHMNYCEIGNIFKYTVLGQDHVVLCDARTAYDLLDVRGPPFSLKYISQIFDLGTNRQETSTPTVLRQLWLVNCLLNI